LSGGEAQRVKLSTELSKRATGSTLYILDEPTTGLSFEDCSHLLRVLHRLVDAGNTVVLIEHHMDLIKNADWIIDLGPGAGDGGGSVIAEGTPQQITESTDSHTGRYLKAHLLHRAVAPVAD
ncbi:MAG: excinuclease ABC subunit A, partial [SAR202 cluster bacterium]|nr:excinuclease ABC subunit A [SAR202 cluster bacterium]